MHLFIPFAAFSLIALSSRQIAEWFSRIHLPLISGFLFTGIIAGPYILGVITTDSVRSLRFVDEISLGFIALAAGSELYLKELKNRWKSIQWISLGQVFFIFLLCIYTIFRLSGLVPFLNNAPASAWLAVALLASSILVARSPSSAIAIINEIRARGTFTQTVLGVIVIADVIVIILFAISSSVADALLTGMGLNWEVLVILSVELTVSLAAALLLALILHVVLSVRIFTRAVKIFLILFFSFSVFVLNNNVRHYTDVHFPFQMALEPLLICMIAGFVTANRSVYRGEFLRILKDCSTPIYIAFFTLTGASLALNVVSQTWKIGLILIGVRAAGIFLGSFLGGTLSGDPARHNAYGGLAYITQAGVGLGLAREVTVQFPGWGDSFASLMIGIIILNQLIGPPLLKFAFFAVGEARRRAASAEFDGELDALIFGLEDQSLALARQLKRYGWEAKIASRKAESMEIQCTDIAIQAIPDLSLDSIRKLEPEKADALVMMLSDEENYQLCEMAYEYFGNQRVVVRVHDRDQIERFSKLGAYIVDPSTALVSLMFYFVRSPSAVSLLLGMGKDQDVVDLQVRNPDLHGALLRDLRFPLDSLILAVRRKGHQLISHGYTRLELGDWITVIGTPGSLKEVALRLERS